MEPSWTGRIRELWTEVFGDPATDYSVFTVVEIEGDGGGAGLIDDGTFTVGTTGGAGFWTTGFQSNLRENGTVTLLLVEGFIGSVGVDLDKLLQARRVLDSFLKDERRTLPDGGSQACMTCEFYSEETCCGRQEATR